MEVYVTQSAEDIMTSTRTKDLSFYNTIAILAGDSAITEFVQYDLLWSQNGARPYAHILHLPGGTSNAVAMDAFGQQDSCRDIIQNANTVGLGHLVHRKK